MSERIRFITCPVCDDTITQRPYVGIDGVTELWNPPICPSCKSGLDHQTVKWLRQRYGNAPRTSQEPRRAA